MGKRPGNSRLLKKVSNYLDKNLSDIICLQENPHAKEMFTNKSPYLSYKIVQSKKKNMFFSNANTILSRFAIVGSGEISFSKRNKNKFRRMASALDRHECVWADIKFPGVVLRVYNCHLKLMATTAKDRLRAIEKVYKHAKTASGPVVVCGDMNTVLSHRKGIARKVIHWFNEIEDVYTHGKFQVIDERYGFRRLAEKYNMQDVLKIDKPTFAIPHTSIELFKLKLDWILIKKMRFISSNYGPYISDHRPIRAIFEL